MNVFITEMICVYVFISQITLHSTFSHIFLQSTYINARKSSLVVMYQGLTYNPGIYLCVDLLQNYQPDSINLALTMKSSLCCIASFLVFQSELRTSYIFHGFLPVI